MTKILQKENPILRQKSKEVPLDKISDPEIKKVIKKMSESLEAELDGVAIAAPQIGELWRIFVVSGKVSQLLSIQKNDPTAEPDFVKMPKKMPDEIFINPKIIKKSKETETMEEGCLSARWFYGSVRRAKRVTVEAFNEEGKKIKRGASGLLAQIFQHEIDHLDGVLFIDKAMNLEEIRPDNKLSELT